MTTDPTIKLMMQETARAAAKEAVKETLTSLGVDASDPLEVQRDMAALRDMRLLLSNEEFQADLAQIRAWRTSKGFIYRNAGKVTISVVVTAILGGVGLWLRAKFGF